MELEAEEKLKLRSSSFSRVTIGLSFSYSIILDLSHVSRFSEIFFVDASDKLTLENGLIAIASRHLDKPSVDDALRLLRTRRENWLLFLDNADDTSLDLRPYVSWPHGNVLITTRNRNVRTHAPKCNIWVDKLEVEDATDLLLRGVDIHDNSEVHELSLKIVHVRGAAPLHL
jgi:hypothetical protein